MDRNLEEFLNTGRAVSPISIVDAVLCVDRDEVREYALKSSNNPISKDNIPQYSCYDNATYEMLKYLRMAGDFGPSFIEVGEHFLGIGHKEDAYRKYGQNHSRTAELLGLVIIKKTDKKRVYLSEIGKLIERLEKEQQYECFTKLAAKIPVIREAIRQDINTARDLEVFLNNYLSPITAIRRRKNTWDLIEKLRGSWRNGV